MEAISLPFGAVISWMTEHKNANDVISDLLSLAGIDCSSFDVVSGDMGGNNRIDMVHAGQKTFVAKWYFSDVRDSRDRLGTEWAFLEYAQKSGLECVPAALARHPSTPIALYEFIKGRKLEQSEVGVEEIKASARFLADINRKGDREFAKHLPMASEAYLNIKEHLGNVQTRFDRFEQVAEQYKSREGFSDLLSDLQHAWRIVHFSLIEAEQKGDIYISRKLEPAELIISPSDFGFHNTLKTDAGTLRFIDFEYAGWDDPAKTFADFFLQPTVDVPLTYFDCFAQEAGMKFPDLEKVIKRTKKLLPLFAIKWACIILNPFVPEWAARTKFANSDIDLRELQSKRLVAARRMVEKVHSLIIL